jgi:hypothetical protein
MSNYSEFKKVQANKMLKEKALIEQDNSELNFSYVQPNSDSIIPTIDWNEETCGQWKYFQENNE